MDDIIGNRSFTRKVNVLKHASYIDKYINITFYSIMGGNMDGEFRNIASGRHKCFKEI